jgi:hypothetical protein
MMSVASGSPRAIDSANFNAWSAFILPGNGAVLESTTASRIAGPGAFRNCSTVLPAFCGRSKWNPTPPQALRESGKVDRLQVDSVLRIAKEDHLFPLDLAEVIVLDDHHFDGQLIFHGSDEIGHQHAESAIADERDHLSIWIGELRSDRIRQAWRHGRQIPGERVNLSATRRNVASPPGRDGATVAGGDSVVTQRLPNSAATTCGFMGMSVLLASLSIHSHHSLIPSCAFFRKLRSSFFRR